MALSGVAEIETRQIESLLPECGLTVTDRLVVPGRPPTFRAPPEALHPRVRQRLATVYSQGIYAHQASAIQHFLDGHDVCLATPTASGKSLAFMSAAAHAALTQPEARVLALYPMKALIRDQLEKWRAFVASFGLEVGFIDGSVPVDQRATILARSHVVAMTPDVLHAWLMSRLSDRAVAPFVRALRLLVLDEAHVYEGVFGTNMAYLLRRLRVAAGDHRLICSTATLNEPSKTMEQLTGRPVQVLGLDADGSAGYAKTLLLTRPATKGSFDAVVKLLVALSQENRGRFLAFADSRKAVEKLTAATHRVGKSEEPDPESPDADAVSSDSELILPYRAGYEELDRSRIQAALAAGELAGVVSTSALELGLDIGEIDVVILTNSPPTTKSFHQRIGRAGRRRSAVCVVVDDLAAMGTLAEYLSRPAEPGWIYMDNRYIQYSQALCAASELQALGVADEAQGAFSDLPRAFVDFVGNELRPTRGVEDDLFVLKQRGQAGPHYEFPVRSAGEQNFAVRVSHDMQLGALSHSQMLREAYPGAIYYYMAKPYRVVRVDHKRHEVTVRRDRYVTTNASAQATVFANFGGGMIQARRSPAGFIAEVDLQVSERVLGFTEQRGPNKQTHLYGPGSPFSQRPLTRIFRTTGILWAFPGVVARTESLAQRVMEAFCRVCGVLERDVGFGLFMSNSGPFDGAPVQGMVVYDATSGSLRLTQRLLERLAEVLAMAIDMPPRSPGLEDEILKLANHAGAAEPVNLEGDLVGSTPESEWVEIIAPGQQAMLLDGPGGAQEVKVIGYRYTPQGLVYELHSDRPNKWMVAARRVQPLIGVTRTHRVNLNTGEEEVSAEHGLVVPVDQGA